MFGLHVLHGKSDKEATQEYMVITWIGASSVRVGVGVHILLNDAVGGLRVMSAGSMALVGSV